LRHQVKGSDVPALLEPFAQLQAKARERTDEWYPLVVIRETGLEGFWMHPCLIREGIESHVVEAALIAALRRSRRAKTDKPDGEALIRTLLAYTKAQ
jgi:transposase